MLWLKFQFQMIHKIWGLIELQNGFAPLAMEYEQGQDLNRDLDHFPLHNIAKGAPGYKIENTDKKFIVGYKDNGILFGLDNEKYAIDRATGTGVFKRERRAPLEPYYGGTVNLHSCIQVN